MRFKSVIWIARTVGKTLFDVQSSAYVPLWTVSQGRRLKRSSLAILRANLYLGPS